MREPLRQMEEESRWPEIVAQGESLCDGLSGDSLARTYLSLSEAHAKTGSVGPSYRESLRFALLAVSSAVPGGLLHAWALARAASQSSDCGDYRSAEKYANAYLRLLPAQPEAMVMEPFALAALGCAYGRTGKHGKAISTLRTALSLASGELCERITLILSRVYARGGMADAALSTIPTEVQYISSGAVHAARALAYLAKREWSIAHAEGLKAVAYLNAGEFCPWDSIVVGELFAALKIASSRMGLYRESIVWSVRSAALLSPWNAGFVTRCLLSTIGVGGGEFVDAETSHTGAAGHHRCGLVGCVG